MYDVCSRCGAHGGPFKLIDGQHVCNACLNPVPVSSGVQPTAATPFVCAYCDRHGFKAVPTPDGTLVVCLKHATGPQGTTPIVGKARRGNNDPCPCNSGKKFKKCCKVKAAN